MSSFYFSYQVFLCMLSLFHPFSLCIILYVRFIYHTEHLWSGFMRELAGQLYALEKSLKLYKYVKDIQIS